MKRLFIALGAFAGLAVSVLAAQNYYFSGTGVGSTTLSYFIANGNYGLPRLNYLNVTSDKAASVVKFYTASTPVLVTATNASGQTTVTAPIVNLTGIATNSVLVIKHTSGICERVVVSSAVTSSNFVAAANLLYATAVGDPVYLETSSGTIPVGAATKELNAAAGAIWNGQSQKPLLLEVDGTSACSINSASGIYDPNAP